jgi:hypothetical protein
MQNGFIVIIRLMGDLPVCLSDISRQAFIPMKTGMRCPKIANKKNQRFLFTDLKEFKVAK